jgi:hypothetical protein
MLIFALEYAIRKIKKTGGTEIKWHTSDAFLC